MKVSDYVAKFLTENGIRDLFLISGGGIMHLLDSVAKQDGLNLICNLNEQATGICAESYGQYTNHLGACLVTTGPGATNAITGCAGAWLDSTPVLFLSGQTKTADMGQNRGLRQFGAQEVAIVPMVTPITKYAITVMKAEEIRYHLEKAVYLATHARRGPVWIDIPLDIQGSQIEEAELKTFDAGQEGLGDNYILDEKCIADLYDQLNQAKRPVVLMGHGVAASGKGDKLHKLLDEFQIPALSTWRAKGIYGDEEMLYMGSPGIPATRYSNYVLQNADFLLIIGTRLNPAITAYDEDNFAPMANKIIVEIDKNEIAKFKMHFSLEIEADAGLFIDALVDNRAQYRCCDRMDWIRYCQKVKEKYPLSNEVQPFDNEGKVDGFLFAERLSNYVQQDDILIGSSSGRTCGISHMALRVKKGQKFITSMGLGSMGWCLPSAIGSCVASGRKRTIVLEGDGSLQHNIQELALINTYNLPVKIFVYSNSGYASIWGMQKNSFNSTFAGCNSESGVKFPEIKAIANAYNLDYLSIETDNEIEAVVAKAMEGDSAVLCEVKGSVNFDEIPKSKTTVNKDGTFSSSKLEYLYPFIDAEEHKRNMLW